MDWILQKQKDCIESIREKRNYLTDKRWSEYRKDLKDGITNIQNPPKISVYPILNVILNIANKSKST